MRWFNRYRVLGARCDLRFCTAMFSCGHFFPRLPFFSGDLVGRAERSRILMQREGRKTATHPEFVFLGIDQITLELPPFLPEELEGNRALQLMTERPFPWSREVWALLLDRLFAAGARLVIFDMIFSPPDDGDPPFGRRSIATATAWSSGRTLTSEAKRRTSFRRSCRTSESHSGAAMSTMIASATSSFFPDSLDGSVRSVRYTISGSPTGDLPQRPSRAKSLNRSQRACAWRSSDVRDARPARS